MSTNCEPKPMDDATYRATGRRIIALARHARLMQQNRDRCRKFHAPAQAKRYQARLDADVEAMRALQTPEFVAAANAETEATFAHLAAFARKHLANLD